ncbi:MAG: hypothetical protein ACPG5R_06825 [Cognaticolwellia aestuarii]
MKSLLDYFYALKSELKKEINKKGVQTSIVDFAANIESWKDIHDIAVLVDFPSLEMSKNHDSAGRNNENVNVILHCILSNRIENHELKVIALSSFIKRLIVRKKWGLSNANNPENIRAYPSDFKRGENGFICWSVEFDQTIKMDETLEQEQAFLISDVFFGINPKDCDDYKLIGTINE